MEENSLQESVISGNMSSSMQALGYASSALQAATSLAGLIAGSKAQDKQNKFNMEMARWQFDKNLEMWNLQQAYNTPTAQMERLRAAGLNPNLVYGNGADNTASSAPQFSAPHLQAYQGVPAQLDKLSNALTPLLQVAQMIENINLTRAQKYNLDAKTANENNRNQLFSDTYDYQVNLAKFNSEKSKLARDSAQLAYDIDTDENFGAKRLRELNVSLTLAKDAFYNANASKLEQETAIKKVIRKWYQACSENPILQDATYKKFRAMTAEQQFNWSKQLIDEGLPPNATASEIMLAKSFGELTGSIESGGQTSSIMARFGLPILKMILSAWK